jgi:hypothetical protein
MSRGKLSRGRRFTLTILTLGIGLLAFLAVAEVALRVFPIPGIRYNCSRYDRLTGGGLYPGSESRYRNDRGELIRRKVNRWGYLDRDWKQAKPAGIYRIGFFGDSYTESEQVPLADTFFRRIEGRLRPDRVECLAFGTDGYSTLQSYLNCMRWAPRFNLDLVVYVFCENDVSDQIRELKGADTIPYPVLNADGRGFTVDNSFRKRYGSKNRVYFRVLDYLTSHSLVLSTLSSRLKLLAKYGVKMRVTEADRTNPVAPTGRGGRRAGENRGFVDEWPDSLRNHAWTLEEAVISRWKREVEAEGRRFALMYIPREDEVADPSAERRAWKPYLSDFCARGGIPLIDPTPRFRRVLAGGKKVYSDHFTVDGHEAFAETFVEWYRHRGTGDP